MSTQVHRTFVFPDGGRYNGYIDTRTGAANGNGIRQFPDGTQYEGDWQQGVMEGTGTMIFGISCPSLDSYSGQWRRNKFHGQGILRYQYYHTPNVQARYQGEFKFGKMDGKGERMTPHGERYRGYYKQDKRDGSGTQIWEAGHCYDGEWRDDKRHGYGKLTNPQGELIYEGYWKDDRQSSTMHNERTHGGAQYADVLNPGVRSGNSRADGSSRQMRDSKQGVAEGYMRSLAPGELRKAEAKNEGRQSSGQLLELSPSYAKYDDPSKPFFTESVVSRKLSPNKLLKANLSQFVR